MTHKVLLNALHTTTGGGLVYLQNVLPYLAADKRFSFILLAPAETLKKLDLPRNVATWTAPHLGFAGGHAWEQLVLPFISRDFDAMWCNANYVPLLARKPIPTIHTTPRAAAQAQSWGMRLYWLAVRGLTTLSLWRAPAALSVARHVIADYVGPRTARKVRVASPAAPAVKGRTAKVAGLVLAVGDYYPQKNYPELLEAFALLRQQVPQARLEIIGRAIDPLVTRQVKEKIAHLGLSKAVKEAGPLPHAKLMQHLAAARAFVSLSRAECFNMPVLEALAAGTPVVAADLPFQHEVAGQAALYVPLDGPGVVAAALGQALRGDTTALVAAGRARAKKFSWAQTATTIADTLYGVLVPARRSA